MLVCSCRLEHALRVWRCLLTRGHCTHTPQTGDLLVPLIAHTLYDAIIVFAVHLDVTDLSKKEQQDIIAAGAEGP